MTDVDETRGSERAPTHIPVTYEVHESMKASLPFSDKKFSSTLLDISATGCALLSAFFVPRNVLFNLEITASVFYPGGSPKTILATGRVLNSRNVTKDSYRLGVYFEKISPEDMQAIKRYVEGVDRRKEKRISFGDPGASGEKA